MRIGYDRILWEQEHIAEPVIYDQYTSSSILLSGSSGSGKTIALLYAMHSLNPCDLYFFDFKGDFQEFSECKNYKSGDAVIEALEAYHEDFQKARRREYLQTSQRILVIDEYPALISYLDKKSAERIKTIIQSLLMLGRGVQKGWGTWICTQRPDAALFGGGGASRINFMILLHMGRSTADDWKMNFAGLEKPNHDFKTGQGFVWVDGYAPRDIIIPHITNLDQLVFRVKQHLNGVWTTE